MHTKKIKAVLIHYNNPTSLHKTIINLRLKIKEPISITVIDNSDNKDDQEATISVSVAQNVEYKNFGGNLGWGSAINKYIFSEGSNFEYILICAHDAVIERIALPDILSQFEKANVWAVGPQDSRKTELHYSNSRFFHDTSHLHKIPIKLHPKEILCAHSTAVFMKASYLRTLLFDEEFFIYGCESEIFLRAKKNNLITMEVSSFIVLNPTTDSNSRFIREAFVINSLYCAYKHGGRSGFFIRFFRAIISCVLHRDVIRLRAAFWALRNVGSGFRTFRNLVSQGGGEERF